MIGSDISTRVLERARAGHYPLARNGRIPQDYLHRFCLKGQGSHEGMMLIGKQLRERVHFSPANLNEPMPDLGRFDVIFLRNILIYFHAEQKRKVVEPVLPRLHPHGLLIVGHSENLAGISDRSGRSAPGVPCRLSGAGDLPQPRRVRLRRRRRRMRTLLGSCVSITLWHPG